MTGVLASNRDAELQALSSYPGSEPSLRQILGDADHVPTVKIKMYVDHSDRKRQRDEWFILLEFGRARCGIFLRTQGSSH